MDMTGERRIAAPRQLVWDALNDPDVLQASIPGCDKLEKLSDTQMKATAAIKIGPISARFSGAVQLSDIDAPNGYTISGEGQGGVAGFAKGGAKVKLEDDPAGTILRYEVNAQVGGKIAQLGARLIDATAKQMAEAFFDRFSAKVTAMIPPPPEPVSPSIAHTTAAAPQAHPPPRDFGEPVLPKAPPSAISPFALVPREIFGLPIAGWLGIGAFAVMLILMLGSMLK